MSVSPHPGPADRPSLLIVDDEPDVLETLRHLFRRRYRVHTSQDPREALEILARESIDVILCDQRMPGMTGDALLSHARSACPETVRLLFTGYADVQAVSRAINQGEIFRYILKPWVTEELEAIVGQAVDQHALIVDRRRLFEQLTETNTRLKEANRQLEQSNRMKDAFLEVASHELNTPVTIVLGLSEILLRSSVERPERERAVVTQVAIASRQLARLIGTMLTLAHSNADRTALRVESTDLALLLHSTADQLAPIAGTRNLRFDRNIAPDLGAFDLDPDKIRDVVTNLLSNAIKFTPDGRSINLAAQLDGPDVAVITVKDEGIGLEAEALAKIFDPFFTELDPSCHSSGDFGFRKRGMGLGLSLVQSFVQRHGGQVSATSVPEQGTTVTVRLPRRTSGGASALLH